MTLAPSRAGTMTDVALAQLRERLTGELVTPDNPAYEEARKVANISANRFPYAVVRAANAEDVAAAVNVAREHGMQLAVRSGGHSLAYFGTVNDGLVIDLSQMKRIQINPETRIARVQGGVNSGELGRAAHEYGLAMTTGDTSSVGLGGLTTGGGIGFMVRKYGLTIDHLLAAQVVTASGDILHVSETNHADLFWAIRGGGGNFGVITEFTFRLEPVSHVLGGDIILPASHEVIRGYLEYSANAPDGLSTIANLAYLPPFPFVPEEHVGKLVLDIITCWTGDMAEGEQVIAPLRALATPLMDTVRHMPYPDIYLSTEHQAVPHGVSLRSMFANEISDEMIDSMLDAMTRIPSPLTVVHLRGLGGQLGRISNDATAFAHRDKKYLVALISMWLDPADDPAPQRDWVHSVWEQIRHEGSGVYVNFLENEGDRRVQDAYPVETLGRLAATKRKYDPGNLFRLNQNVAPAPTSQA